MSNNWPKQVPVLTAENMCKSELHDGEKSCLLGWLENIFYKSEKNLVTFYIAKEMVKTICSNESVVEFNDTHTLEKNSEIWNKAMKYLDYTEEFYIELNNE